MESSRNIFLPRDRLFEERGILDPEGKNDNPLTKTKYVNLYENDTNVGSYIDQAAKWGTTPIYERRNEILNAIYDNQVILLVSGTGSGKTVPAIFGIADSLNKNRKIIYQYILLFKNISSLYGQKSNFALQ